LKFWKKKYPAEIQSIDNAVTKEDLGRVEVRQKEMSLQLDEIIEILQDGTDETVNAAMSLFGMVFDFCIYCENSGDGTLGSQAGMMRREANKVMTRAGFRVVEPMRGVAVDISLHTINNTESIQDLPDGVIIKTISPGFVKDDKILRRAVVVVNKK
jgi:hypothetical protein